MHIKGLISWCHLNILLNSFYSLWPGTLQIVVLSICLGVLLDQSSARPLAPLALWNNQPGTAGSVAEFGWLEHALTLHSSSGPFTVVNINSSYLIKVAAGDYMQQLMWAYLYIFMIIYAFCIILVWREAYWFGDSFHILYFHRCSAHFWDMHWRCCKLTN